MRADPASPVEGVAEPTHTLGTLRATVAQADVPALLAADSPTRLRFLHDLSRRESVSVARLVEAHLDARIILAEAGVDAVDDALYGVWASRGSVVRTGDTLAGTKPFCSGVGLLDRALITVTDGQGGGTALLDVDLRPASTVEADPSGWHTPALRDSATGEVRFQDHPVAGQVGPSGWYLDRPGFWQGALRPAACWAGAATGLVDVLVTQTREDNPHAMAHLGAALAVVTGMQSLLARAGQLIDAAPRDVALARSQALSVRHLIERGATEILDRLGRALGPRPYVGDAALAQRAADLHLYLRQHHAEQDLAALASHHLAARDALTPGTGRDGPTAPATPPATGSDPRT